MDPKQGIMISLKFLVILAATVTQVSTVITSCGVSDFLLVSILGRLPRRSPQLYDWRDYLSRVWISFFTPKWLINKISRFLAYNPPAGQKSIQVYIDTSLFALIPVSNISQREWDTYNPITDPVDPNIACNVDGSSLGSGQLSATVAAGSQIKATWNQWPHTVGREYQTTICARITLEANRRRYCSCDGLHGKMPW